MTKLPPKAIRIAYLTRANLLLRRAHTRNILKTVQALNHQEYVLCELYAEHMLSKLWHNRNKYDVVYFRDHHLVGHAIVARMLGKKVVHEVHSTHGNTLLRNLAVTLSHGLVFITQKLKKYYLTSKPSAVVHCNGVDTELFEIDEPREALRENLGLPIDRKLIMYVGSTQWYELPVLLDMMAHIDNDSSLVLVGLKDQELVDLQNQVATRNLEPRVVLQPRVSHHAVCKYLVAADILVNPLQADLPGSISSKLYEYLASGRPIVSTQGGANNEILKDAKNSLIVKLTGKDFANKVNKLMQNSELANKISEQARQEAAGYTWDERARVITALIREVHE
jgi:glycosyltransferase involved in cell wall biosynthesis